VKTPPPPQGFSLVEVTISVAILSFCLLTLLALLPIGLSSTTESLQATSAAGIASQIAADLHATPLATSTKPTPASPRYGLTLDSAAAAATSTFYLDDTGNPTGASGAAITSGAIYKATVVITNPKVPSPASAAYFQNKPTTARIIITWPAQADPTAGAIPTNYQGSYESVTAVDRN
jgi:uncharacterized protein (TIGR02598 family)